MSDTHFLQPSRRRRRASVATSVLVFRASGGLHHFHPGDRFRFYDHSDIRAAKAFGYTALVLSMIATAFIGFGVWVHHMFATPLPQLGQSLFTAASLMIVIPNGDSDFLLARDALGRTAEVETRRCCSCSASSAIFSWAE